MNRPDAVEQARLRASAAGFALSCADEVGALMAVLAAGVPPKGRVLELGTGAGVGLAWTVAGLDGRTDVEVHSVEIDHAMADVAAAGHWPPTVTLHRGDALHLLPVFGAFDLVFADAQGGKIDGLECTLSALAPGGHLVVDDMAPKPGDDLHASLWPRLQAVRERLLGDPDLHAVELAWSTGVIVATRRR